MQSFLVKLILIFAVVFVFVRVSGPLPLWVNSVVTQKTDSFSVSGEGKITIPPDQASVTIGVSSQASTVAAAQTQLNTNINSVTEAIKALGISRDDIKTQYYNISPNYDYSEGQRISGYSASTNLIIKVKDLDKTNSVIDTAAANGANQVGGISFELSDPSEAQNQARQMAVDEAKQKAQQAANIAGFRLGRIINYSESFGGEYPRPYAALDVAKAEGSSVATDIQPGTSEVIVNVSLSYELE